GLFRKFTSSRESSIVLWIKDISLRTSLSSFRSWASSKRAVEYRLEALIVSICLVFLDIYNKAIYQLVVFMRLEYRIDNSLGRMSFQLCTFLTNLYSTIIHFFLYSY